MQRNFHRINAFTVIGILGILSVAFVSIANGGESASSSVNAKASKSLVDSLEDCTLVSLNRVYFGYEDSNLSAEEKIALNGLVSRYAAVTQSVIELRGYADGMESAHGGPRLGTLRSQKIARYLIANGIPSQNIVVVAATGMSDEEKSMNAEHRRVDIRVFTANGSDESTKATGSSQSHHS